MNVLSSASNIVALPSQVVFWSRISLLVIKAISASATSDDLSASVFSISRFLSNAFRNEPGLYSLPSFLAQYPASYVETNNA